MSRYMEYEHRVSLFFRRHSILILRIAMGIIYFWYGMLKICDMSPIEELVEQATNWAGKKDFVFVLGIWEIVLGLCLFIRRLNRVGLILLFLQFPGTFLPLFLTPEDCFTVFPFGLTLEGQYIFKNLILISAGLVLIGSLHKGNTTNG